jgi:hypothetical protein
MFGINLDSPVVLLSFIPLAVWGTVAIGIALLGRKNSNLVQSIPSGFTATGVLGTFIGIFLGLQNFDVENIQGSISILLEGLKSSFSTSILGISLSILSGITINFLQKERKKEEIDLPTVLNRLANALDKLAAADRTDETAGLLLQIKGQFDTVNHSIRNWRAKAEDNQSKIIDTFSAFDRNIQALTTTFAEKDNRVVQSIKDGVKSLSDVIQKSNDSLSEKIADMNTKGLLKAMEDSVALFNSKMEEMLERLVKENFQALNQSVQQLNTWQQENKKVVEDLLLRISTVLNSNQATSRELAATSTAIQTHLGGARQEMARSAESLARLVDENGKLQRVLNELENVTLGDNNFRKVIESCATSLNLLNKAIEYQRDLTQKLITDYSSSKEMMLRVIEELQKLSSLKDVNGEYWTQLKSTMEEMLSILNGAAKQMSESLLDIDQTFRENLHHTFSSLDSLIGQFVENHLRDE